MYPQQEDTIRIMHVPPQQAGGTWEGPFPDQKSVTCKLGELESQGAFLLAELRVPGGGEGPPIAMRDQSTTYYLLEGEVSFSGTRGEQPFDIQLAEGGSVLHVPVGLTHAYKNTAARTARLVMLVTPARATAGRTDDAPHLLSLVPPLEGMSVHVLTDVLTFLLRGEHTGGAFLLFETLVPPAGGPLLHRQTGQEAFYILEGTFIFTGMAAGRPYTIEAQPGAVLHARQGVLHAYRNVGERPGRILVLIAPAGRSEQFFRDVGVAVADATTIPPPRPLPETAQIIALMRRYGIEVVLPGTSQEP